MEHTMISFRNNEVHPLTIDELKVKCPYAFKKEKTNPNVSEKYKVATTLDVINDMEKLGWYPVEAKQCRTKKNSSGIRSFHMIALQSDDERTKIYNEDGTVESHVRIILQNSHDGFNSFKFMCGIYRCVCSNGLIIADAEYAKMSVRHINYNFDELRSVITCMVESLPEKITMINNMKNINLTDAQKTEFATNAIKVRKNVPIEEKLEISKETIDEILNPIREEDKGNSLWNVFNVIQEKVIKGNFSYAKDENSKSRKMRKIVSPVKDVKVNYELFKLANNYMAVAA